MSLSHILPDVEQLPAVRRLVDARRGEGAREGDPGVLAASGMIAGEGLAGVLIAALVATQIWTERDSPWITGPLGVALGILLVVSVSALLYQSGRGAPAAAPHPKEEQR